MASSKDQQTGLVTVVDLLRHGECQGGQIFRGTTDSPLTETGWQQMHDSLGQGRPWQRVICSPLQRCRAFAEQLTQHHAIPVSVEAGLREIDFGEWEGQLIADVWERQPELIGEYFSNPGSVTPLGGEPLQQASERVITAWQQLLANYRGQQLLLVAHSGTIRLLLAQVLSMPLAAITRFDVPHGSRTQLKIYHQADGDYPSLVSHNGPLL